MKKHLSVNPTIHPLGLGLSLLYFGLPALCMVSGFYVLMPYLTRQGMTPYMAYLIGTVLPLALMLVMALVAFRLEGHPLTWRALMERFNYRRMSVADWGWTALVFAVEIAAYVAITRFSAWLIESGVMPLPASLPAFMNPRTVFTQETLDIAAGGLRGNWVILVVSVIALIINVVGEEFWWRGYILPRQLLAFGALTWVVHGVLWTGFHIFKWWDLLNLLPLSLGLTWVVLRRDNNTPGLVIHFITNGVGLFPIFLGVLGI
ncbi:MAG: CPBP family intramembrane metalloprotease [Anaerolineae bacterium]|nr:CPBP family intramembrane metalloprotease [Anaerolineae bacterium]